MILHFASRNKLITQLQDAEHNHPILPERRAKKESEEPIWL
jgi:hypothetical protein